MNKQKQKDLLKFQLDHQPQKWRWKDTRTLVAVVAFAIGCVSIVVCLLLSLEPFAGRV